MSPEVPEPDTTASRLADLDERRRSVSEQAESVAVRRQSAHGKLTARQRIEALVDPGSFRELDQLARHGSGSDSDGTAPYGDGVVTGVATVNGRTICLFSQDFSVFGGSLGEVFGQKVVKVMDVALQIGCPIVGINDSGGARIQEGVASLGLYGEIFYRNTVASGFVPQVSVIAGPCAGGAVYSPALTDFTVMVDQIAHMFITGPDVIKAVTGEDVGFEELGGATTHAGRTGNAHYVAPDEGDAFDFVRALLGYLPQSAASKPPRYAAAVSVTPTARDLALDAPGSGLRYVPLRHARGHLDRPRWRGAARDPPVLRPQHHLRVRAGGRLIGGRGRQPAHALGRHPGHRRRREGGPVRPDL